MLPLPGSVCRRCKAWPEAAPPVFLTLHLQGVWSNSIACQSCADMRVCRGGEWGGVGGVPWERFAHHGELFRRRCHSQRRCTWREHSTLMASNRGSWVFTRLIFITTGLLGEQFAGCYSENSTFFFDTILRPFNCLLNQMVNPLMHEL